LTVAVQGFVSREVTVHKGARSQESGEPAAKIAKVDPVKVTTKRTATFVPLQDVLDVDWSSEIYAKRLPKADPSYFLMRGNVRFHEFRLSRLSQRELT
jgi:hypothetical protein